MARYFAGNSLAAFSRLSTASAEVTTAGRHDPAFVSNSISIARSSYIESPALGSRTTLWVRYTYYQASNTGASDNLVFLNSSGTPVLKLTSNGTTMQYWNGSAWVSMTGTFTPSLDTLAVLVIKVTAGVSGTVDVYIGGTLVFSASGMNAAVTNFDKIRIAPMRDAAMNVSEVMIADYDLRDSHYMTAALNGNSAANTGGSGAYTQINETVLDDSTSVTITTAGNKQGQTHATVTVPAGYIIGAAVLSGRGRVNGSITNGKLGLRTSGGTNSSGSGLNYNGGYEPRVRIIDNDPDTATNFTQAGFNAAEPYQEAA